MNDDKDKRAIDDPMLNQDSVFDKKDDEDFDSSDDFHKYDDTDTSENDNQVKNSTDDAMSGDLPPDVSDAGKYDGNIAI